MKHYNIVTDLLCDGESGRCRAEMVEVKGGEWVRADSVHAEMVPRFADQSRTALRAANDGLRPIRDASSSGPDSRRILLYRLSPQALITLLKNPAGLICHRASIPLDGEAVAVGYDEARDTFAVAVRSETFEPVEPGMPYPWADDPWFKLKAEDS